MKKILLAFLLLIGVEARAQKSDQILVVTGDADVQSWTKLVNTIKLHYDGVVSVRGDLPADLDYDAIMMLRPLQGNQWLDSIAQDQLIDYLKAGGQLYAEGADFRNRADDPGSVHNQLWDFIGDSSENLAAMEISVDRVHGIDGEFAQGLDVSGPIVFSRYSGNYFSGLLLSDLTTIGDLSGVSVSGGAYGAYDTIDHNSISGTESEIRLQGATLIMGTSSSSSSNYGQNTVIGNGTDPLIQNTGGGTLTLAINENYWGFGPWNSLTLVQPTGTGHLLFNGVQYNNNPQYASSPIARPFNVSCGTGFESPLNVLEPSEQLLQPADENLDCEAWFLYGRELNKEKRYAEAYDTMKAYIRSCHTPWIKPGFGQLSTATQYMSIDNERWREYREWLKSVLYLNQVEDAYYCEAITAFMSTFQYLDPVRGMDYNGEISMIDYVVSTGKCLKDSNFFSQARASLRYKQVLQYMDTVKDQTATPLDTSAVSLNDIGLGIIYGPTSVDSERDLSAKFECSLSANPAQTATELNVQVGLGASLSIELYDALGVRVQDHGRRWLEEGNYSIPIDVQELPTGVYHLRIASATGDVQTLKLIKL